MKRVLLTLGLIAVLVSPVFSADGDFAQVEVREDVATYALDTFKCTVFTRTCTVTYRKVDSTGAAVGEEISVSFRNVADDPDTVEDETLTDFTDLVAAINAGSNIRLTLGNATKIKLGL